MTTPSGVRNSGVFTGTAAALGTITGCLGRAVLIKVVTSGTETVTVSGTIAGTTVTTAGIMFKSLATGALYSSTAMDDGTYYLEKVYTDTLIFTGSATSDTKTVTYLFTD